MSRTHDNHNWLRIFAIIRTMTCVRSTDIVVAESGQEATVGDWFRNEAGIRRPAGRGNNKWVM